MAAVVWVVLTYGVPGSLLLARHRASVLGGVNGSWRSPCGPLLEPFGHTAGPVDADHRSVTGGTVRSAPGVAPLTKAVDLGRPIALFKLGKARLD